MANNHMKRCQTSKILRALGKCKLKSQWEATLYQLGCLLQKKKKISVGKDMEKLEPLYTVGENVKWYSLYEKQFDSSSKN